MILLGMFSIGIGAIYDDYWHAQFGIDTTVILHRTCLHYSAECWLNLPVFCWLEI